MIPISAVAKELRVGYGTIYRWVHDKRVKSERTPGASSHGCVYLVDLDECKSYFFEMRKKQKRGR
jgi:excisionase family DNA binding protein